MVFGPQTGVRFYGPLFTRFRLPSSTQPNKEYVSIVPGWNVRARCSEWGEFAGAALSGLWVGTTVQTAGSPTAALDATVPNGVVKLLIAATNEVESARLSWNDKIAIPGNKRPLFDCFVNVGVLPGANERMVWGLSGTYNATLNSVTRAAWFRLEGNGTLVLEATDGTNTTRLQACVPAMTLTAGQWYRFQIDMMSDPSKARFFVDGNNVGNLALTAIDSTKLQPLFAVQKDSGTGVPSMSIDYSFTEWDRA